MIFKKFDIINCNLFFFIDIIGSDFDKVEGIVLWGDFYCVRVGFDCCLLYLMKGL